MHWGLSVSISYFDKSRGCVYETLNIQCALENILWKVPLKITTSKALNILVFSMALYLLTFS